MSVAATHELIQCQKNCRLRRMQAVLLTALGAFMLAMLYGLSDGYSYREGLQSDFIVLFTLLSILLLVLGLFAFAIIVFSIGYALGITLA